MDIKGSLNKTHVVIHKEQIRSGAVGGYDGNLSPQYRMGYLIDLIRIAFSLSLQELPLYISADSPLLRKLVNYRLKYGDTFTRDDVTTGYYQGIYGAITLCVEVIIDDKL